MSVRLRLRRMGKKKQPIYKVVAADSRSPRDGRFLEAVGLYNPLTKPHTVEIKEDRVLYWLDKGAQPTDTVKSLLTQKGIILKKELKSKGFSEEKIQEEIESWQKLREAKTKSREKKKTKDEVVSKEKVSDKEVESIEESTAEVKGAASDTNESQ